MTILPPVLADRLQALMYNERSVAYLRIDAELKLTGAGGHLAHYGLTRLRLGEIGRASCRERG